MRLAVAIFVGAVGYTLLYAGMKGGPSGQWAHQPWLLWVAAFQEIGSEAQHVRTAFNLPAPGASVPLPPGVQGPVAGPIHNF